MSQTPKAIFLILKSGVPERVPAAGAEFIFIREGENIQVTTKHNHVKMSAGEKQEFKSGVVDEIVLTNLDSYEKRVIVVLGKGDYNKFIVSGFVRQIGGVLNRDGVATSDDRITQKIYFNVTNSNTLSDVQGASLIQSVAGWYNGLAPTVTGKLFAVRNNQGEIAILNEFDLTLDSVINMQADFYEGFSPQAAGTMRALYYDAGFYYVEWEVNSRHLILKIDGAGNILSHVELVGERLSTVCDTSSGLYKIYQSDDWQTYRVEIDGQSYSITTDKSLIDARGFYVVPENDELFVIRSSPTYKSSRLNFKTGAIIEDAIANYFDNHYFNFYSERKNLVYGDSYLLNGSSVALIYFAKDKDFQGSGYAALDNNCNMQILTRAKTAKIEAAVSYVSNEPNLGVLATGELIKSIMYLMASAKGKTLKFDYLDYVYRFKSGDFETDTKDESFLRVGVIDSFSAELPNSFEITYSQRIFKQ